MTGSLDSTDSSFRRDGWQGRHPEVGSMALVPWSHDYIVAEHASHG